MPATRALLSAILFGVLALAASPATAAPQFRRVAVLGTTFLAPADPAWRFDDPHSNPFWAEFSTRIHQKATLSSAGIHPYYLLSQPYPPLEPTGLGTVIASDAEACLIIPDDRDAFFEHPATTKALLTGICQQLKDHRITPILCDPLPAAPSQTPERAAWALATRQAVAEITAADSSIVPVSWYATLDPDGDGYGDPACFNTLDRPNREGLSRLAQAAATKVDYYMPGQDIYSGLTALTPNPLMQPGISGTPGVPATRPNRWIYDISSTPENPAPAVTSSVIRRTTPFLGYWWQLTVAGSQERDLVLRYDDPTSTPLQTGDRVELLAEYETGPDLSPGFTISPSVFGVTAPLPPADPFLLTGNTTTPVTSGTLRSLPFTLPDLPPGLRGVTAVFRVHGAGTFRLGRVNLHRIEEILPGPYRDDLDASLHGVRTGDPYRSRDATPHLNAGPPPIRSLALWGDSLADVASTSRSTATLGERSPVPGLSSSRITYSLVTAAAQLQNYSVIHRNPGGTGPLSLSLDGPQLTVTLGRENGSITSTTADIRTALLRDYSALFTAAIDERQPGLATASDQPAWFAPDSNYSANSSFTWLQVLSGQAFDLDRRPTGDWDYGYSGRTAAQLAAQPGPAADILASPAGLIVGCAGAYDLAQGATPQQTCDRITTLWDLLLIADRPFVWLLVPPAGSTAAQQLVAQTNELLRLAASERDVVTLPWLDSFTAGVGHTESSTFPDGLIPSSGACREQAAAWLDFFQPFFAPAPRYDLTPASWITANPTLATGTTSSASAAPTFWHTGAPGTATFTRATPAGQSGAWTQVKSIGAAASFGIQLISTPATTNWSAGDYVEGIAEVSLPATQQLQSLTATVSFAGTSGQVTALQSTDPTFVRTGGFTGVLRTPACIIPHGTTAVSITLTWYGDGDTCFIRHAGVRRVGDTMSPGAPPAGIARGPVLTSLDRSDPARTTGNYAGSIYAYTGSGNPSGDARGGFDSFRLDRQGNYTARGRIDGAAFSIKGRLDPSGSGISVVKLPAALTHGAPVELTLYLATGDDGTVRITGVFTGIPGPRPLAVDLVRTGAGLTAAVTPGAYTAFISTTGSTGEPQAPGVATFSLTASGSLRCRYVLPDGTLGTRSAKLAGDGVWQFYFPASGSAGAKGGLLAGHLQFRRSPDPVDFASDLDGVLSWQVPANPRAALFPGGFDTQCSILGWKYTPAPRGAYALPGLAGFPGNNVVLSIGQNLSVPSAWSRTDVIKGHGLTARLNRATGLVTGVYTYPPSGTKFSLYTIILQNDGIPGAGLAKSRTDVIPAALDPIGGN